MSEPASATGGCLDGAGKLPAKPPQPSRDTRRADGCAVRGIHCSAKRPSALLEKFNQPAPFRLQGPNPLTAVPVILPVFHHQQAIHASPPSGAYHAAFAARTGFAAGFGAGVEPATDGFTPVALPTELTRADIPFVRTHPRYTQFQSIAFPALQPVAERPAVRRWPVPASDRVYRSRCANMPRRSQSRGVCDYRVICYRYSSVFIQLTP